MLHIPTADLQAKAYAENSITLSAQRVAALIAGIISVLLFAHVLIQFLRFVMGNDRLYGLAYLFSFGAEHNVPTLYSSLTLLLCALLLAVIGFARHPALQGSRTYWLALAAIFVFLALDESLQIHEKLIEPMRNLVNATGALYYAWVIPYSIGVLLIAAAYVPFLTRLPRRTALLFVLAGTVFVSGAVGFEMLSGIFYVEGLSLNPAYVVAQTIEELFEMAGIGIFIFALADYIGSHLGGLSIAIPRNGARA